MNATLLFTGAVQLLVLLLGISVHESAHALVADLHGDSTARLLGRATLNPLKHLEPIGSVLLPLLLIAFGLPVFGWGRPTPVLVKNLRDPYRDDILVTAAGSAANLLLSAAATVALAIAVHAMGPDARQAASLTIVQQFKNAGALAGFPLVFTLVQLAYINAFLGLFNMIPLPPLDGGQIALYLLPPDWAAKYAALRPYGFTIGIFLAVCGVLTVFLLPFSAFLNLVVSF